MARMSKIACKPFLFFVAALFLVACGPHWRTPSSVLAKCHGSHACIEICTDYQEVQFGRLYCKQLQREQAARLEPHEPADTSSIKVRVLDVPDFALPTPTIVSRSMPAVVKIQTGHGFGTGFSITKHGLIVTNYHVIAGESSIAIEFDNGHIEYISEIAAYSERYDLAILQVSGLRTALAIGPSGKIEVGEPVLAIGHPLGYNSSVATGILSGRRIDENNIEQLQTTVPMAAGASGGPLLDKQGRVIGVMQAAILNAQLLTFAIPISDVKPLLYKVLEAPNPIPIAEFAKLTRAPEPDIEITPAPPRTPPVAARVLQGCSRADRVLITETVFQTLHAAGHLCDAALLLPCVYVYVGAAEALEKHLSATCTAPRAMLSKARQDAIKLDDPKAHEKTLRVLFESLGGGAEDLHESEPVDPK